MAKTWKDPVDYMGTCKDSVDYMGKTWKDPGEHGGTLVYYPERIQEPRHNIHFTG